MLKKIVHKLTFYQLSMDREATSAWFTNIDKVQFTWLVSHSHLIPKNPPILFYFIFPFSISTQHPHPPPHTHKTPCSKQEGHMPSLYDQSMIPNNPISSFSYVWTFTQRAWRERRIDPINVNLTVTLVIRKTMTQALAYVFNK